MSSSAVAAGVSAASPSAAPLRLYVHSVLNPHYPAWPEVTWAVSVASGETSPTLRKLKQLFKEELMRKTQMDKNFLKLPIMTVGVLKRADGRELGADDQKCSSVFQDRDDIFFELKGAPAPPPPEQPSMKHKGGAAMAAKAASSGSSSGSNSSGGYDRSPSNPLSPQETLMYHQLTVARDLQGKGQLKKARDLYQQLLATVPADTSKSSAESEHRQSARQICHQQLGVIFLYNKQYEQARPHLEAAVKIVTSGASEANAAIVKQIGRSPQPELAQLISLVGQCWLGVNDFSEAQTHFERALKLLTPKGDESSKDPNVVACLKETKVWLARAMYRGSPSERGQALAMFEQLIAEDEHNVAALTHYAAIAIECGKKGEVLPYLLRALVAAQAQGAAGHSKGSASYEANIVGRAPKPPAGAELDPQLVELVQVLLTDLVMLPDGVNTLFSELHAASTNHAALSFLAQTVKDQGGVTAAIAIYRRALQVCDLEAKARSALLLNLVHTMELEYQYNEAFALIRDFCRDNPTLKVGHVSAKDFHSVVGGITDVFDVRLRTGEAPNVPAWCAIMPLFDEGVCHVTIPDPSAPPAKKAPTNPYPADELQLLALFFTALKMLYVCGGLQVLPALVNLLEPLRVERDLHLTLIRNEHAYASSIAQMLRSISFPLPAALASLPADDVIYVCGDSHSMSAAWQVIHLSAHPRPLLLVPRLVTGLKVWHMRPACRFYPKRNFEAALRHIPSGSQVIFNFGEIDCREGLLVAVEKGRYESVDQGVRLAVDVYVKALQEKQAAKDLRVYVHPITPVLDVTRPTVKMFESCLKERLAAANAAVVKHRSAAVAATAATHTPKDQIIYLDFFRDLLTPDGNGFNMAFHLDSTHLKPTYVHAALQPCLERLYVPKSGVRPTAPAAAVKAAPAMSTMDKINASLLRAQMGDFGDDEDEDHNGMD